MVDALSGLKNKAFDLLAELELAWLTSTIQANIQDSLVLTTKPVEEDAIPIGQTKFGGSPDLPLEFEWPTWHGEPLAFIAQINLAELPDIEFLGILPASGVLYFFNSAEQATSGYDPKDKGSWRVCYENVSDVHRRQCPSQLAKYSQYKSCSASFSHSFTIPDAFSSVFDEFDLSSDERGRYIDYSILLGKDNMGRGTSKHRLLGHPDQIQGDMRLECQLVSNGLFCGDSTGYNDPRAATLRSGAKNWELLLQVDTDYDAEMLWCGAGTIYFWIPNNELAQRNFDATWMIMQCD